MRAAEVSTLLSLVKGADDRKAVEAAAAALRALSDAASAGDKGKALIDAAAGLDAAKSDLELSVALAKAQRHVMAIDVEQVTAAEEAEDAAAGKPKRSKEQRRKERMNERRKEVRAWQQKQDLERAKRGGAEGVEAPVETLPGIGKTTGQRLRERGVSTVRDLLFTLPRRYDDERRVTPIGELEVGKRQVTAGVVSSVKNSGGFRGRRRMEVVLEPLAEDPPGRHGLLRLTWFRAYGPDKFERGMRVRAAGAVDEYKGQIQMVHPETLILDKGAAGEGGGVVSRYPDVGGVAPRALKRAIEAAIERAAHLLDEAVPRSVLDELSLPPLGQALTALHKPRPDLDEAGLEALEAGLTDAHRRLIFEEFFLLELALHQRRADEESDAAEALTPAKAPLGRAVKALPFDLTTAQKRVVAEIDADLRRDRPMRRLLQGDVGAGKTAVAMLAAAHAVAAGAQVAFLAPTEILAEQHFRGFAAVAEALGLRLALVVGGARAAHRRKVKKGLADGTIDVAVGTHALLTEGLDFHRLRLAIVDEQHRFGVGQRLRLVQKGESGGKRTSPHLLVMTATPIPRSLALALYGDLEVSILDELPPGRIPATTRAYALGRREEALRQVGRALESGGQAYIICPLVEQSEELDLRDATNTFEEMKKRFGEERVGLVHGRLGTEERSAAMARFSDGETQVLVSTTVVEVGVDVKAANVVLIEHAERFGLAQLHQLRGRVGRGGQRSACLLVHDASTPDAKARMEIMCETTDGFRIADADLSIRGPGELFGRRQSGLPGFRFGDLRRDLPLLDTAREKVREMLETDPALADEAHAGARAALGRLAEGPFGVVREEAG